MRGGEREVLGDLSWEGVDAESRTRVEVSYPIAFYQAGISVDAIISFRRLAEHNFVVEASRHGLSVRDSGGPLRVEGDKAGFSRDMRRILQVDSKPDSEAPSSSSISLISGECHMVGV